MTNIPKLRALLTTQIDEDDLLLAKINNQVDSSFLPFQINELKDLTIFRRTQCRALLNNLDEIEGKK